MSLIDSLSVSFDAGCSQTEGFIELYGVPGGIEFSIDGVTWAPQTVWEDLSPGSYQLQAPTQPAGITASWTAPNGMVTIAPRVPAPMAGSYLLTLSDTLNGCSWRDSLLVTFLGDQDLLADFLVAAQAVVGDSVALINLTDSLIDSMYYTVSTQDMDWMSVDGRKQWLQFYEPGVYEITMTVSLGDCSTQLTRSIEVVATRAELDIQPPGGTAVEIASADVYPNPHQGIFTVDLMLNDDVVVNLYVFDGDSQLLLRRSAAPGSLTRSQQFDVNFLPPQAHTLVLTTPNGIRHFTLIRN